jgi:hypothetical protein
MYTGLLVGIVFAVLFYRAATYERMSGVAWAVASFALSIVVNWLGGGILSMLLAQVGLFLVMWWYNANRKPPAEETSR